MVDGLTLLDEYDKNAEQITRSNANYNVSFSGKQSYVISKILKEYAINQLEEEERRHWRDGDYYIHNLSEGMQVIYCLGGSLLSLLQKGLSCGGVSSKPAKHFDSAVDQLVNYLMIATQEVSGAVAFSDFNTLLSPFIKYDGLTEKQVKQILQRMVFNLSFPSRKAFQNPFSNLSFNLNCPKYFSNMPTIICGEPQDSTYADYEDEANLITRMFTDVLLDGDGVGRQFTFPIPTMNLTWKTDFTTETFNKVLTSVAKLGSYSFMNYRGTNIDENGVRAMCCRLNLSLKELSQARGLWNIGDGTGSLCVVTLNLGRLGYLVNGGANIFDWVDVLLDSARKIFSKKRSIVKKSFEMGYFPLLSYFDLNLDHFFNTIGIVGLNEMYMNIDGYGLFGHVDDATKFLDHINKKLRIFQEEDGVLYNLEMTPAEESANRLAAKDIKQFPDIITQGTRDIPYYTSMLVPPSDNIYWGFKMEAEARLMPKFSGGTVHRLFIAREDSINSIRHILKDVSDHTIPYFDFTPTVSYCPICRTRKVGVIVKCSECGSRTEIFSRVVGYVRKVSKWSDARQNEFWNRKYVNFG